MKKIISLIVVLIMLCPVQLFALASTPDSEKVLSWSFESDDGAAFNPCSDTKTSGTSSGTKATDNTYADVYGRGNALKFSPSASENSFFISEEFPEKFNTGIYNSSTSAAENASYPVSANGANAYVETSFDILVNGSTNCAVRLAGAYNTNIKAFATIRFEGGSKMLLQYINNGLTNITLADNLNQDTWYNVRVVMHLTDASSNAAAQISAIYLDGTNMLDAAVGMDQAWVTDNAPYYDRIQTYYAKGSSGYFLLDNVNVYKYSSADGSSPVVDKYALVTAIRAAEANESFLADSVLEEAKRVYEDDSATQADVNAALTALEKSSSIAELFDESFESDTSAFAADDYAKTEDFSSQNIYGINKAYKLYLKDEVNKQVSAQFTPVPIYDTGSYAVSSNGANAYAEVSFDIFAHDIDNYYYAAVILGSYDQHISGDRNASWINFKNGTIESTYYTSKYVDSNGATQSHSGSVSLGNYTQDSWHNVKMVLQITDENSAAVKKIVGFYLDGGENRLTVPIDFNYNQSSNVACIDSIRLQLKSRQASSTATPYVVFDNFTVKKYNLVNGISPLANKSNLLAKIREIEKEIANDTYSESQLEKINPAVSSAKAVYEKALPTQTEVDAQLTALNASLPVYTGIPIEIPGSGEEQKDVSVRLALHYGEREGIEAFDEIFIGGKSLPDFSDVYFTDKKEASVPHEIISSGNYDFIKDDAFTGAYNVLHLSDGTLVAVRNRGGYTDPGEVSVSEDNGKTWTVLSDSEGNPYDDADRLTLIDKDDNIYYCQTMVGVYKLYAEGGYKTRKIVLDYKAQLGESVYNALDLSDNTLITGPSQAAQADDGYIYLGQYQGTHCPRLYGSSDGGDTFNVIYDYEGKTGGETDIPQHVHKISINRNVTPNEVYVSFDWAAKKPIALVSTDHFETYESIDIPYRNSDYNLGYFGDGFSYFNNPEGGFALGGGEANILGGPTVYKTTDAHNPDAYYGVVETQQGVRSFTTPDDGATILFGGLSGRAHGTNVICASYDKGETWETIYAEEADNADEAGAGVGRYFTDVFTPKGADEAQLFASGYSRSYNLRMKFGDRYKYALCYVKTDIPADGKTIYLNVGGDGANDGEYSVLSSSIKPDGTVSSVRVAQLKDENNAVLVNAVYDARGKLIGAKTAKVDADDNYDLNVNGENAASSKLLLWKSLSEMVPFKLSNNPLLPGNKFIINSNENMFADNLKLRLKLDEGSGSTVTDSVSGKSFAVEGSGHIWTENAQIRYGGMPPLKYRSNTSLKLNKTSYINLGNVEGLDFSKDMTFVFWSNPETKRGYGTEWNVPGDTNQTHKQVIFKSDDLTIYQQKNYLYFRKSDNTEMYIPLEWASSNSDYYNLNFIVYHAPTEDSDAYFEAYGNDAVKANQTKTAEIDLTASSLSSGNLYLGTPNATETEYSMWFGLADVMIYDKALTAAQRRAIYYGSSIMELTSERK